MKRDSITYDSLKQIPQLSKSKNLTYSRLGSAKFRKKENLFMAVGKKCVSDTIDHFEPVSILVSPEWIENQLLNPDLKFPPDLIPLFRLSSKSELSKISGMTSSPEIIAIYKLPELQDSDLKIKEDELALMLDGIQDPGNFGSILRTADWFGVNRIFASHNSVDLYNPKVIQSTMGSVSRVEVIYTDLKEVIASNPGVPVYGTLLDGENIYQTPLSSGSILVMGNEGNGISDEIRKMITHPLLIPPYNPSSHGESLNVGAATAITLSLFRFKNL